MLSLCLPLFWLSAIHEHQKKTTHVHSGQRLDKLKCQNLQEALAVLRNMKVRSVGIRDDATITPRWCGTFGRYLNFTCVIFLGLKCYPV